MEYNKILGKRVINKAEEYLVNKNETDLKKKHTWRRTKQIFDNDIQSLIDALDDFEMSFSQRDYVDLLRHYHMNTSTYSSFRIINGKVEKPVKVLKKDAKIPIKKVLMDAYFQKMRILINDR